MLRLSSFLLCTATRPPGPSRLDGYESLLRQAQPSRQSRRKDRQVPLTWVLAGAGNLRCLDLKTGQQIKRLCIVTLRRGDFRLAHERRKLRRVAWWELVTRCIRLDRAGQLRECGRRT